MTTGVHEYRLVTVMPQWLSNSHHVSSMDDSRCEVIAAAGGESESYARHGGRFMSGGRYDERRDVLHHRNHWRRAVSPHDASGCDRIGGAHRLLASDPEESAAQVMSDVALAPTSTTTLL